MTSSVALSGVAVSVPAIGPNVRWFKPSQKRLFVRAIKIRSTTFFGGEVKPSAPCRKILQHIKEPYSIKRDTS
jgi:hypothetical protein